jgi:hypothetical protein
MKEAFNSGRTVEDRWMWPWNGPFEQDGTRVYRMAIQWTDRWIGGIAAMVPNEIHYLPNKNVWATCYQSTV